MIDNFQKHGKPLKIPGSGCFKISVLADLRFPQKCKTCGKDIFFAKTRKGKLMAIQHNGNSDQYVCHYNHCENKR